MERQSSGEGTPNKSRQQQIAEKLMAVRLREAESLAELKSMKQKVMELETQVGHTPQWWSWFEIFNSLRARSHRAKGKVKAKNDKQKKFTHSLPLVCEWTLKHCSHVMRAFALNQISNIVINRDTNTNEENGFCPLNQCETFIQTFTLTQTETLRVDGRSLTKIRRDLSS